MAELLQIAGLLDTLIRYPTVVFTVPLALILLYWVISLATGLGTDLLDGALDGLFGGADAAADAALDGAVEAGGDGGIDGDAGSGRGGILEWLDMGGVPVTVVLSVFVFSGWVLAYVTTAVVGPAGMGMIAGSIVLVVAGGGALLVTKGAVRPLKRFLKTDVGLRKRQLIGRVCEITTLKVTDKYGQAEVADGGAGLMIQVRSSRPDELTKGAQALIHGYDPEQDVFQVRAVGDSSATELDEI